MVSRDFSVQNLTRGRDACEVGSGENNTKNATSTTAAVLAYALVVAAPTSGENPKNTTSTTTAVLAYPPEVTAPGP